MKEDNPTDFVGLYKSLINIIKYIFRRSSASSAFIGMISAALGSLFSLVSLIYEKYHEGSISDVIEDFQNGTSFYVGIATGILCLIGVLATVIIYNSERKILRQKHLIDVEFKNIRIRGNRATHIENESYENIKIEITRINPPRKQSSSIASDVYLATSMRSTMIGIALTLIGCMIYLSITNILSNHEIIDSSVFNPLIIAAASVFLMSLRQATLHYRVNKGYFGYNAMEAMRLAEFIAHKGNNGSGDGGGWKRAMREWKIESDYTEGKFATPKPANLIAENGQ